MAGGGGRSCDLRQADDVTRLINHGFVVLLLLCNYIVGYIVGDHN
jgi:hypothetical protein